MALADGKTAGLKWDPGSRSVGLQVISGVTLGTTETVQGTARSCCCIRHGIY